MNPKKDGSLAGYSPPFEELRLGSTPLPIGLDRTLGAKCHVNEVQAGRDGSDSTAVDGDCQIVMRMRMWASRYTRQGFPGEVDRGSLLAQGVCWQ